MIRHERPTTIDFNRNCDFMQAVPEGWIINRWLFPFSGKIKKFDTTFFTHNSKIVSAQVGYYYADGSLVKDHSLAWEIPEPNNQFEVALFPLKDRQHTKLDNATNTLEKIILNMYGLNNKQQSVFIFGQGKTYSLPFNHVWTAKVSHDDRTIAVVTYEEIVIVDNPLI